MNNASFGAYAAVVQSQAYRDDKVRTTLDMLPDLLARRNGVALRVQAGELQLTAPQAVLVSNNSYGGEDPAGLGACLDSELHAANLTQVLRVRQPHERA